jgi:hypothetical protein
MVRTQRCGKGQSDAHVRELLGRHRLLMKLNDSRICGTCILISLCVYGHRTPRSGTRVRTWAHERSILLGKRLEEYSSADDRAWPDRRINWNQQLAMPAARGTASQPATLCPTGSEEICWCRQRREFIASGGSISSPRLLLPSLMRQPGVCRPKAATE